MTSSTTRTQVGIVGGGPAGLMLSHLLALDGIDSVVIESRTRAEIEQTVRAGILERGSVRLLVDSGVSDRVLREGHEHEGIDLRFAGSSHRIDFQDLVGRSVWLYPQTDVFLDLADARARDGADIRFSWTATKVDGVETDRPTIEATAPDGSAHRIECDVVVGSDGSRSVCRQQIPEGRRTDYFREYPFAWFGILAEAPPNAPELIYAHSDRGFALISQRTATMQRMYFQCDPTEDPGQWSDDQIWSELQSRVTGPDGLELVQGPITDRSVLRFRSFVTEPLRHGRLLLAGDAAHTVPPTGAKGLNLALADVRVLAESLQRFLLKDDHEALDAYSEQALDRVWRAQHYSYWMTTMLHTLPGSTPFDHRRQIAELTTLVGSSAGSTLLADGYTGWA